MLLVGANTITGVDPDFFRNQGSYYSSDGGTNWAGFLPLPARSRSSQVGWMDLPVDLGHLWLVAHHHVPQEGRRGKGGELHENHDPG